jgi:hypothetical protein
MGKAHISPTLFARRKSIGVTPPALFVLPGSTPLRNCLNAK